MRLIVGLGNPAPERKHTRHNAGFIALDALVKCLGCSWHETEYYHVARYKTNVFLKPMYTSINHSGVVVKEQIETYFYNDLYIVRDDIDLPLGTVRYRFNSGHGGHNGVKSIITELGTSKFHQIKLGIGRGPDTETISWVLSPFSQSELTLFNDPRILMPYLQE